MQAIIIIVVALAYLIILLQYQASTKSGARDIAAALSEKNSLQLLNRRTVNSTPLMILSSLLCFSDHQNVFLRFGWNENFSLITILLLCLFFWLSVYSGFQLKWKLNAAISIRESMSYLCLRVPGLIVYEIFFRGVLLGIFLEWFPISVAILLNMVLYALAHAFSSRREFFGSFPFGLILCYLTILNQSIYPAVLLHLCLALPYETIFLTKHQLLAKKF